MNNCAAVTAANKQNAAFVGFSNGCNCPGDMNMGSLLVDYRLTKHIDVYSGASYSAVSGGFRSGYLNDNMTVLMSGLRLKF
jgi:predicted porin